MTRSKGASEATRSTYWASATGVKDVFADALQAFQRSEAWLTEERGPDHPYVIAAIVMVAYCHARMKQLDEACRHYDRALAMMEKIGERDNELARQIREYVATVCG